jgi:hypothetical protein
MTHSIPSSLPSLEYFVSEAQPSIDKNGRSIPLGKQRLRLRLGEDARFRIAAIPTRSHNTSDLKNRANHLMNKIGKTLGCYVEIQDGSEILLLNTQSIAKRLPLKKKTILNEAKRGELISLLSRQILCVASSLQSYENISTYFKDKDFRGKIS